ncbi:MAG: hypothetical protein KH282_01915 [Clostridiales bacterium]|nr:hypothetical protein [Clostridiales bacterium]
MKSKKKDEAVELLKKTELYYKPDSLTKPFTVFVISAIAAICDAVTVFLSLDPILKGNQAITLLMTFMAAFVLDVLPSFWPYGFDYMNTYKKWGDPFRALTIKIFLVAAIVSWGLVMLFLSIVRYAAADIILINTIREFQDIADSGLYQPQVTGILKFALMTFMNVINIASSAAVLFAASLSYNPFSNIEKQKKATFGLYTTRFVSGCENTAASLYNVAHDSTTQAYEQQRIYDAYAEAQAQAERKKAEAREEYQMRRRRR